MADEQKPEAVEAKPEVEIQKAPEPTAHELSVKCLDLAQRLNGQIHHVTQVLSVGEDAAAEKALAKATLQKLTAACEAAGM